MAFAEFAHAAWVRKLAREIVDNGIKIKPGRFKKEALETAIDYMARQTTDAGSPEMTSKKAIAIAADIENSLIEKKFFEVFDTDCKELRTTLEYLEEETRDHVEAVNDRLAKSNERDK